jgi:AraC-like DNA-binding protein
LDKVYSTDEGKLIIVPPGVEVSVVNMPHPLKSLFVGAALSFDRATLDQFRTLYAKRFENWDLSPRWTIGATDKLLASIANWLRWSREFDVSKTELRHRLMEIMLILAEQGGVGNLLIERRENATSRLRSLFALDPSRQWSASEASARLGMSVSSLQRRLREHNSGFRLLLEDVRLNRGLELVLGTDAQIGSIARSCGYESQSRFSERFRLRFSTSPSELRQTREASASRPGLTLAR